MHRTVIVRKLTLPLFIGVLDHERETRQRVTFDIEMEVETAPGEYVSYADIVEHLRSKSSGERHIELVETLADEVFEYLFSDPRIAAATVTILKPDIIPEAEGVGFRENRRNPDR